MSDLPSFTHPPVSEVALAVQFEPLGLSVVELVQLHEGFRDKYPLASQKPRKTPMTLGDQHVSIRLGGEPESPCLWFETEGKDQLVQMQDDRLVVNWRRDQGVRYPRYEVAIRPMLEDALDRLIAALERIGHEAPKPNVCEVAYVNPIESGAMWEGFDEVGNVIAPWSGAHSDEFLPPPSSVIIRSRYPIDDGRGSVLDVSCESMKRAADGLPALMLQLSARGVARDGSLDGAFEFLDLGREWIVKGFRSFTTERMHEYWGVE